MVKIRIIKDGVKGADDGATVRAYPTDGGPNKDGVYNVSRALAAAFIEAGEGEEVETPSLTETLTGKKARKAGKEAANVTPPVIPAIPTIPDVQK